MPQKSLAGGESHNLKLSQLKVGLNQPEVSKSPKLHLQYPAYVLILCAKYDPTALDFFRKISSRTPLECPKKVWQAANHII